MPDTASAPVLHPSIRGAARTEVLARFVAAARGADLVSFDLFDTLLRRRCGRPEPVFTLLAERAARIAPDLAGTLAAARVEAEREARRQARKAGRREVSLEDIYAALADRLAGIDPERLSLLSQIECEIEIQIIEADPEVAAVFHALVAEGARVVLVSDMYLPAECLEAMLARAGLSGHERLFLSNACGAAKADGSVWPLLRRALALPDGARIVHLGDHPQADGSTAVAAGIAAHVLPLPEPPPEMSGTPADGRAAPLDWLGAPAGPPDADAFERYWHAIGRRIVLPAALGLSAFIREVGRRFGTDRVFFLARDGLIFQKAFEATRRPDETPSRYLWASRRCLNVAAMFELGPDDLAYLSSGRDPLRPADYLARIDLPVTAEIAATIERHFGAAPGTVETPADKARLHALFRELEPAILERARQERSALMAHLDAIGLFDGPAVVVDLGWHGTLQRSLLRLGRSRLGRMPDLAGVYLGTLDDRPRTVDGAPMHAFGWLFEDGAPDAARARTVDQSFEVIELLFSAPEAGVRCVGIENGEPRPVRQPIDPAETGRIAVAQAIHDAVSASAARFGDIAREIGHATLRAVTLDRLQALLCEPSREDIARFGSLDHAEGFGVAGYRSMIGTPPPGADPRGLLRAYRASFWPRAFLRTLPPPARWALPVAARVQDRIWHLRRSRSL